jgi:hypothetical protein
MNWILMFVSIAIIGSSGEIKRRFNHNLLGLGMLLFALSAVVS